MTYKESKSWYQKGAVQAAFIAGAFGILIVFLRPESTQQVVVIHPPQNTNSQTLTEEAKPNRQTTEALSSTGERRRASDDGQSSTEPIQRPKAPPSPSGSKIGNPQNLLAGEPWFIPSLSTAITAAFRETLGSQYVEITVAPPGEAPIRFPARNAGASVRFSSVKTEYEVQVLGIDWNLSQVNVIVRPVSASP